MPDQRIRFVSEEVTRDPEMAAELERCAKFGTPRPESQAIRAHRPPIMMAFATVWKDSFHEGIVDHSLKELCRVYVSRSVKCEYCGNQRSEKGRSEGLVEDDYMDLLNFEKSENYDTRQKAALAYTEAITWDIATDDGLWARLHEHFSEPELVELGFFIALTMGQQRWLRTLNIQHHSFMAGTTASMAPGFEDAAAIDESKKDDGYWAKS
jgi:alkylhydroperoxidase family enzyme